MTLMPKLAGESTIPVYTYYFVVVSPNDPPKPKPMPKPPWCSKCGNSPCTC